MGHDAKVSLKHYAQVTDEHFERTTGAQSGSPMAQFATQHAAAASCKELNEDGLNGRGVATYATPSERVQHVARSSSGEGGIRTRGRV